MNTWTIKSTVMESSSGPMDVHTRVTGRQVNSTVRVFTSLAKAPRSTASGKRASASAGSAAERAAPAVQSERAALVTTGP